MHTAKMHTFHDSEVLTAATATEITLNGSKQPFCFYSAQEEILWFLFSWGAHGSDHIPYTLRMPCITAYPAMLASGCSGVNFESVASSGLRLQVFEESFTASCIVDLSNSYPLGSKRESPGWKYSNDKEPFHLHRRAVQTILGLVR